jgi:hypothetical protein
VIAVSSSAGDRMHSEIDDPAPVAEGEPLWTFCFDRMVPSAIPVPLVGCDRRQPSLELLRPSVRVARLVHGQQRVGNRAFDIG